MKRKRLVLAASSMLFLAMSMLAGPFGSPADASSVRCTTTSYGTHCSRFITDTSSCGYVRGAYARSGCAKVSYKSCFTPVRYSYCTPR